jgi:hypothetical protein
MLVLLDSVYLLLKRLFVNAERQQCMKGMLWLVIFLGCVDEVD